MSPRRWMPSRECCWIPTRCRPTAPWPSRAPPSATMDGCLPMGWPRPDRIGKSGAVRDVETSGAICDDRLQWIKFSGASWSPDGQGFFYSRYDEPDEQTKLTGVNYFQKLFYHRLGTPQSEDKLIYDRPTKRNGDSTARSPTTATFS